MLAFKVHRLEIRGRHYILLPKLNKGQMEAIGKRLANIGFRVTHGDMMTAANSKTTLHIEPAGLCWSASDPSDCVLPLIPDILRCEKEAIGRAELQGMYLRIFSESGHYFVKFSPRLEFLWVWDSLRSAAGCGLAPDEHLVAKLMLDEPGGSFPVVTDFTTVNSLPFYSGNRLYFRSTLPSATACNTLRVIGPMKHENSYLPRDGVLPVPRTSLEPRKIAACFEELGEWSSFIAR